MKQVTYIERYHAVEMTAAIQELYENGWRLVGPVQVSIAGTVSDDLEIVHTATLERGEDEVKSS